jgi:hypothetical protein
MENEKLEAIKRDIKQKQVDIIKEAVRLTLEKLEVMEKSKDVLQDQLKVLKHDLFDLKDGRLDRILERQSLSEDVKKVSVVLVTKTTVVTNTSPWYEEYEFKLVGGEACKINNSLTKTHASGSYKLKDGTIRHL